MGAFTRSSGAVGRDRPRGLRPGEAVGGRHLDHRRRHGGSTGAGLSAEKQALLLGEPDLFFTTPAYDGWPLVMLRLEAVHIERLAELVTDAWRMRAPAELAGDLAPET